MGVWSSKPFGNDTALDWVARLEGSPDEHFVTACIERGLGSPSKLDSCECEEVVAAAAIIAAAAQERIRGVPEEAKRWIRQTGFVPKRELMKRALRALKCIMEDSELKVLVVETGSPGPWIRQMQGLQSLLRAALGGESPRRKPKPQGLPRALHKLVRLVNGCQDPKVVARVNDKLVKLDDVDEASAGTGYQPPILLAAEFGFIEGVRLLLDRGADVDPVAPPDSSPFTAAVVGGHLEIAELLLERGASMYVRYYRKKNGVLVAIGAKEPRAGTEVFSLCPALLTVSRRGSVEAAEFLLGQGASLEQWEPNGYSLLHAAGAAGNVAMVKWLISRSVDPNTQSKTFEETPVMMALEYPAVVKVLLEAGADPDIPDKYSNTCIDLAENRSKESTRLLVKHGAKSSEELGRASEPPP